MSSATPVVNLCQLIRCVRNHQCLWDMRDKSYHSRDNARHVWQIIANEMKTDMSAIKYKWRGLRDTFRKEHKRCGSKSTWPYYSDMSFLLDQLNLRKARRDEIINKAQASECFLEDRPEPVTLPQIEQVTNQAEKRSASTAEINTSALSVPPLKKLKSGKMNTIEKLVEIEQMKLEEFKKKSRNELDSDHQFLISLLPYLKKVPEERKMFVRSKLQQVFCDEEMLRLQKPYIEPPLLTPIVKNSEPPKNSGGSSNGWSDDDFSDDDDDVILNESNGDCQNLIQMEEGLGFDEVGVELQQQDPEDEVDVKPTGATLLFAAQDLTDEICPEETEIQGLKQPPLSNNDKTVLRLTEKHFPSLVPATPKKLSPTRHCYVCNNTMLDAKKRRESRYMCSKCGVALCVQPCFEIYHTKEFF